MFKRVVVKIGSKEYSGYLLKKAEHGMLVLMDFNHKRISCSKRQVREV